MEKIKKEEKLNLEFTFLRKWVVIYWVFTERVLFGDREGYNLEYNEVHCPKKHL